MRPRVEPRARLHADRGGDPLDGLVNLFDLGIVLVLIALPALALWVAIPMALGKKKFLPPFVSWFAAMLFAVVPLRNIFPGKPPEGSWVDQAITLWVLLALIVAMTLFIMAYRKQSD